MSSLLHGAEVKEGVLVTGDSTVMAFCRYENSAKSNFIFLDVDDKRLFCEDSVTRWLPSAVYSHLTSKQQTTSTAPQVVQAKKPRSLRKA